ncbi:MAG: acyl-CoA thioesterase [Candidatus Thiodiazotropha sp. (ex Codakia rugifera)]|nr:acyl-CoA thioesterase [Candidatus Thiodiazotropha sp. (ex Codakia rugifera)]
MLETYRGVVYPYQLDHMGHMNVQWYAAKFDEATWQLFTIIGLTSQYMSVNNRGMAALKQITNYRLEVFAGDPLLVKSQIIEVRNKSIRFLHVMYRVDSMQEVANSELVGVHLDRNLHKSCSLPSVIREQCEKLIQSSTE